MSQELATDGNAGSDHAGPEEASEHASSPRSPMILVAEDNKLNCLLMAEQLRLLGFAAEIAESGQEALVRWRTGAFAILLTDIQMPDMDGYELAEAIRSEEAGGARMPIIALTADELRGQAARWKTAGIDDHLTKPAELAALKAMLQRWLKRDRAAQPQPAGDRAAG